MSYTGVIHSKLRWPKPEKKAKKRKPPLRKTGLKSWKMLQQSAPIKPMRRKGKTSHAKRERDFEYMGWVAKLACLARLLNATGSTCDGPVCVHHAFGRRVVDSDRKTIPLCRHHHESWHQHKGEFADWDRDRRKHWSSWAVEYVRLELVGEP